jgi:S1-C subfamily serine protease
MKKITIGRSLDNDINPDKMPALSDKRVSSQHAFIEILEEDKLLLTDTNSLNGTFVNGKQIPKSIPININRGDAISFGKDVALLNWGLVPSITPETSNQVFISNQPQKSNSNTWLIIGSILAFVLVVIGVYFFLLKKNDQPRTVSETPIKISAISFDDNNNSTVKILAFKRIKVKIDTNKSENLIIPFSGSGFIINEKGYILTAKHVITNATEVWIKYDKTRTVSAQVIKIDEEIDLALLKITDSFHNHVLFPNSNQKIHQLDEVYSIGYPSILDPEFQELYKDYNKLSNYSRIPYHRLLDFQSKSKDMLGAAVNSSTNKGNLSNINEGEIVINHSINYGYSGSPLFLTSSGLIVGLNYSKVTSQEAEGLGFAIHYDRIIAFLKMNNINYYTN